ncbi:hypothetical protein AB0I60_02280 [Actinosynnema sp. NPDC050436]|uniref:hypothetical protein n=1 Tax=Actinosynnema sp. NPDC050436 TaxID=3155659 RepID=UPI0033F8AB83
MRNDLNTPVDVYGNRVSSTSCQGSGPKKVVPARGHSDSNLDVDAFHVPSGFKWKVNGSWEGPNEWICVHNGRTAHIQGAIRA